MATTTIKEVKISQVERAGWNPRKISKGELKKSPLFVSIKNNGVQHPVEVRKVGDKYQLLSGDRRFTAAEELKLKTIPAIVYSNMSDAEAYEKTHFENSSREALNPAEMIADTLKLVCVHSEGVKGIKKGASSIKTVAAKLGITERDVKLRLKAAKCIKEWLKKSETEDWITVKHLELVSRLSPGAQKELLDDYRFEECETIEEMEAYVNLHYSCLLADAAFDTKECEGCKHRSDTEEQLGLWVDDKGKEPLRCLSPQCYAKKVASAFLSLVEAKHKEYKNLRVLGSRWNDKGKYGDVTIADRYETVPCKESDAKAFPCLDPKDGKLQWRKQQGSSSSSSTKADAPAKPKSLEEKREDLRGLRIKYAATLLIDHMLKADIPKGYDLEKLICLAVSLGVKLEKTCDDTDIDKNIKNLQARKKIGYRINWEEMKAMTIEEMVWFACKDPLKRLITPGTAVDCIRDEDDFKWVAKLIGVMWDQLFKQGVEAKPEPKSWLTK